MWFLLHFPSPGYFLSTEHTGRLQKTLLTLPVKTSKLTWYHRIDTGELQHPKIYFKERRTSWHSAVIQGQIHMRDSTTSWHAQARLNRASRGFLSSSGRPWSFITQMCHSHTFWSHGGETPQRSTEFFSCVLLKVKPVHSCTNWEGAQRSGSLPCCTGMRGLMCVSVCGPGPGWI